MMILGLGLRDLMFQSILRNFILGGDTLFVDWQFFMTRVRRLRPLARTRSHGCSCLQSFGGYFGLQRIELSPKVRVTVKLSSNVSIYTAIVIFKGLLSVLKELLFGVDNGT
ncbi:uncharacterized protein G2W53_001653 [Senna tora]|uniref:Uncharacterized protein n=1 Tax=Senna tora TaxID=362788 RepID=A0A834XG61_9FABA|nr:uncharacterized protein G2W53_001653 [Senna tora]